MSHQIYFDNNATTRLIPQTKKAILELLDKDYGNPASIDSSGREARTLIENSRSAVAQLIDADPTHIIFTSSGSESNITAIKDALHHSRRTKIIASSIEHSSISNLCEHLQCEGYEVAYIPTLTSGEIDINHATTLIDNNTALVICQMVNNETGVIQPIADISLIARRSGAFILCDAAQAVGKMGFSINSLDVDYLSFTGHKLHAPPGIGALWTKKEITNMHPLINGGSQEYGVRGGTHNLIGIAAFGTAAHNRIDSLLEFIQHTQSLRDSFESMLTKTCDNIIINGTAKRITNTANIQFTRIDGKALFTQLLQNNILCSQSSACTSQYPEPSKVLRAMGLSYDEAFNSIRFSFSLQNSIDEVKKAVDIITKINARIMSVLGTGW